MGLKFKTSWKIIYQCLETIEKLGLQNCVNSNFNRQFKKEIFNTFRLPTGNCLISICNFKPYKH